MPEVCKEIGIREKGVVIIAHISLEEILLIYLNEQKFM